jgi:hypothetical protein
MTSSDFPDPDQMVYAASICGKYCSKTAALTNWIPENEPRQCDACLHWNNKPCSKMKGLLNRMAEEEL